MKEVKEDVLIGSLKRMIAIYILSVPGTYDFLKDISGQSYFNPINTYTGHYINVKDIINNSSPRKILLNGYFQRAEIFSDFREDIKRWLDILSIPCPRKPGPSDLVIHVRGGDLWNYSRKGEQHSPIPLRWYGFWHPDSPRQDIDMRVMNDKRYIFYDLGINTWYGTEEQKKEHLKEL